MPLSLEIVTAERQLFSHEDVDAVTAPAADGEITILPRHASLITLLQPGELRVRSRGEITTMAIYGGFLEVHHSRVRVLADAGEPADEIDVARAVEAAERARQDVAARRGTDDFAAAAAVLRRAQVRVRVARRRRDSPGPG